MDNPIAEPMSDNEALRRIVGDLDALILVLAGDYEVIYGDADGATVTDAETPLRDADEDAIKTVVTNLSNKTVYVYEGGCQVGTLYLDGTWESPTMGKLAISAKCKQSGASATVVVSTYKNS